MIKLANNGKTFLGTETLTAFTILRDGVKVGIAHRSDSGKRRGTYSFGSFHGSRARLLAHVEAM